MCPLAPQGHHSPRDPRWRRGVMSECGAIVHSVRVTLRARRHEGRAGGGGEAAGATEAPGPRSTQLATTTASPQPAPGAPRSPLPPSPPPAAAQPASGAPRCRPARPRGSLLPATARRPPPHPRPPHHPPHCHSYRLHRSWTQRSGAAG